MKIKTNKQGILIIAAGHPYYGKMAAALAASIRAKQSNISIHLAYAGEALKYLKAEEVCLFTSTSIIPEKFYKLPNGKTAYIRTKLFLPQLSPFQQTIFLDCDTIWLKNKPDDLFSALDSIDITYQNHGFIDLSAQQLPAGYTLWADINEVKEAYNLSEGKYYQIHSELMYFEKTEKAKLFFKTALQIYDNLKVKSTVFAGAIPDELAFAIASVKLSIYPHLDDWTPVYWAKSFGVTSHLYLLEDSFVAYSMAGHSSTQTEKEQYNYLAAAAYSKLGICCPFAWKDKKIYLQERKIL